MFQKVQIGRVSEEIIRQVEQAIYSEKLLPGDRLAPERELAEQFGVSRITIRDALRVLESNGLIEIKVGANGGAYIREPNLDSFSSSLNSMLKFKKATLIELTEARKIIETATAELAAERATPQDLENLRELVEAAKEAHKSGDLYYMPHSVNFHSALAKAAKNYILELTVSSFRTLFFNVLEKLMPTRDMAEKAQEDHWGIYEAVKAGNGELARELMSKHLSYFENKVHSLDDSSLLEDE